MRSNVVNYIYFCIAFVPYRILNESYVCTGGRERGSLEDLAFATLLPRSVLKRLVGVLAQHQRVVLVGHPGVGKSFLARRLAEFLVLKSGGDELTAESVALFWANKRTAQECSEYVATIGRRSQGGGGGGTSGQTSAGDASR
jgi:neuron navigator 2